MDERAFLKLEEYLKRIPAIHPSMGKGCYENGLWWMKFSIDIRHSLAWNVLQELSHVINYISLNERLPCIFYPVSPSPYMNGGPEDFLSWIIETRSPEFRPGTLAAWLEGRMPNPVEDETQWISDEA